MNIMSLKYKHTTYTLSEWTSLNPIIVDREIVIESDTNRLKVGNGTDHYLYLEYLDKYAINLLDNEIGAGIRDGQKLRIIEKGEIHSFATVYRFSTLETTAISRTAGTQLGISPTQSGYFDANAIPKLLRATDTNVLKIL